MRIKMNKTRRLHFRLTDQDYLLYKEIAKNKYELNTVQELIDVLLMVEKFANFNKQKDDSMI